MRIILFLTFFILFGSSYGQSQLKPISDEEFMYPDKLNGTLIPWTKKQKKFFLTDCESKTKDVLENSKSYCKCSMNSMMTGINFERYKNSTDYQKGKLTGMHGKTECKAIKKKK